MLWSQLTCATSLFLFGLVSVLYGSRAFAGKASPVWRYFLRPSRLRPDPAPQETMLAALLALLFGTIAVLGGLGLILTALL